MFFSIFQNRGGHSDRVSGFRAAEDFSIEITLNESYSIRPMKTSHFGSARPAGNMTDRGKQPSTASNPDPESGRIQSLPAMRQMRRGRNGAGHIILVPFSLGI